MIERNDQDRLLRLPTAPQILQRQSTSEKMISGNLLRDPKGDGANEVFETLIQSGQVRIERIVSSGQSSPSGFWYDQQDHEFVLVVQGQAVVAFADGREVTLQTGTWLHIEPHQKHRVITTSQNPQTIWLAVFWDKPGNG